MPPSRTLRFLQSPDQLTPDWIASRVLPHLPQVVGNSARVIDSGYESIAIDLGEIMVRYPSSLRVWESLQFETRLCQDLEVPGLTTPKPQIVEVEYPFSWHWKVPGDYLLPETYETLVESQKQEVAERLVALFLACGVSRGR